jgi:alpha-1,4-digalacturonate transport system permease protein
VASAVERGGVVGFLTRTRGRQRLHWTDWLSYGYLLLGLLLMFGPVIWLALSSFKTQTQLLEFPPSLLPYGQVSAEVPGHDQPLPLFRVRMADGSEKVLAQIRRVGIQAQLVDPANPDEIVKVNDTDLFRQFNFGRYLWNSVFITAVATVIMLIFNSMAAFALSKYDFRGRNVVFVLIIATLMIPPTIVLVPTFLVVSQLGLLNNPWGVIWPGAATPTGVFLLRQYMLTIPDDLIDAARMDNASEWKIYWRIILPLTAPALAVLAIFAIMWRWNEFLWPLIVLTRNEQFTLQLALNSFQGEMSTQWNNLLAMTVLTLLPITCVFAFLQRYITTGIASTGIK